MIEVVSRQRKKKIDTKAWETFAERAADVLGVERSRLRFGELPTRGEEMRHAPVRVQRLRELTGWVPAMPIEEGIRRTRDLADAAPD